MFWRFANNFYYGSVRTVINLSPPPHEMENHFDFQSLTKNFSKPFFGMELQNCSEMFRQNIYVVIYAHIDARYNTNARHSRHYRA